MHNTLDEHFNQLCSRYTAIIDRNLDKRLSRARDKQAVAEEIRNDVIYAIAFLVPNPTAKKLTDMFLKEYRQGKSVAEIIADLQMYFGTNIFTIDKHGNRIPTIIENEPEEEKRLRLMVDSKTDLIKYLVRYMAVYETQKRIANGINVNEPLKSKSELAYPVLWTGGKDRDNKNEFVQLVYALHEAGYLNKGKGEITKIVETLAETLQVGLGKNWQSNLSASIHKSNSDYQPPIFEYIKTAYAEYADKLVTAKKSNK